MIRRTLATAARTVVSRAAESAAPASAPPSLPATTPDMFKITLQRSSIGLRPEVRKTVAALGFKKRGHTVYKAVSPANVGKILRIKELVKVDTVSRAQMEEETQKRDRLADSGYTVVGSALRP